MIVIDATLSGVASNSYVTYEDAVIFFEERLWSDVWTNADEETRKKALIGASRRMERETYLGDRYIIEQKLAFPRRNIGYFDGILLDGIIPEEIKECQLEIAIFMLENNITRKDVEVGGLKEESVKVGGIATTKKFITDETPRVQSYNALPDYALSLLESFSISVSRGGVVTVSR